MSWLPADNPLVRWLSSPFRINRSQYLISLGLLGVLWAAIIGWHQQPSTTLSQINASSELVLYEKISWVEISLRWLTFVVGVSIAFQFLRRPVRWQFIWRTGVVLIVAILLFPVLRVHWEPAHTMDSNFLYFEIDRVVSDIEDGIPHQQQEWRRWQKIESITNGTLNSAFFAKVHDWKISDITLRNIRPAQDDFFGLTNAFLSLLTRGWAIALVGSICILLGCYLSVKHSDRAEITNCNFLRIGIPILLVLLLTPRLVGNYYGHLGDEADHRGDYNRAEDFWQEQLKWFPLAGYSMTWYQKIGNLQRQRGCDDDSLAALLVEANDYLVADQVDEGVRILYRVKELYPNNPGIRYWLGSALVKQGIEHYNRSEFGLSREIWQAALAHLPTDAMAWYGLFMANIQLGNFDHAARNMEQIVRLQNYLSFKKLTIRGEWLLTRSWGAYHRKDLNDSFHYYRDWLRPENW